MNGQVVSFTVEQDTSTMEQSDGSLDNIGQQGTPIKLGIKTRDTS